MNQTFALPEWPSHRVMKCFNCHYDIRGGDVDDHRLFKCPMCRMPMRARVRGQAELILDVMTGGYHEQPHLYFADSRKPWPGELMHPTTYDPKCNGYSCWAEPDLAGERLVCTVMPDYASFMWSPEGRGVRGTWPVLKMQCDLARLAMQLRWHGGKEWIGGAAIEVVFVQGEPGVRDPQFHAYHAMPLVSLLHGADTMPLGVRRRELEKAFEDQDWRYVVPIERKAFATCPSVPASVLDDLCQAWVCSSVMLRHGDKTWRAGPSDSWMRYETLE